jgi:hypothetical protein
MYTGIALSLLGDLYPRVLSAEPRRSGTRLSERMFSRYLPTLAIRDLPIARTSQRSGFLLSFSYWRSLAISLIGAWPRPWLVYRYWET